MPLSLYQIAYVSSASESLTDQAVQNLADQAQLFNSLKDISGVLLFNGSNFAQIIEGARLDVEQLYASICTDERHHNVTQIAGNAIGERTFAGWSMKFLANGNEVFREHAPFIGSIGGGQVQIDAPSAGAFMQSVKTLASNQFENPHS